MAGGSVEAIAGRELVHPFDLDTFPGKGDGLANWSDVFEDLDRRIAGQGHDVGVVLHSSMIFVKKIPVPLGLETEMINDQILWEMDQFLIGPRNNYVIEFQRLPFQTPGGNPYYIVIVLRKSVLHGLRSLFKKTGWNLKDVDVDIFALLRVLLINYPTNEGSIIIVDVHSRYLSFICLQNREYYLSHFVPLEKMADENQHYGTAEMAELIIKELRRLVFGHRLGKDVEDLEHVYLTGTEELRPIVQAIASKMQIKIDVLNPFIRIPVADVVKQTREFIRAPEKYAAAVGIAMKRVPILVS